MSRGDEVSKLPDEYLDTLAEATGIDWTPDLAADAADRLEVRRQRVRRALREIAREDAARERGQDPKTAKTR
jgi:hypothetical protein